MAELLEGHVALSKKSTIENVAPSETLVALARRTRESYESVTVKRQLADEHVASGWTIVRENISTVRLHKEKSLPRAFEDRVWTLMYLMGFPGLSGKNGAVLRDDSGEKPMTSQLDVVAFDDEIALFIECRSAQQPRKATLFAEHAAKLASEREAFAAAIDAKLKVEKRRRVASVFWGYNFALTDADAERAKSSNVVFFDRNDLEYFEALTKRIGAAAKYQFLADVFKGKEIPGLAVTVPAIRTKYGSKSCSYTFPIEPEKLLKIAYISHRWRHSEGEEPAYQRFMSKGRLEQIRDYIKAGGYFPTNVVINLQGGNLRFDKAAAPKGAEDLAGGEFGILYLPATYRSAWIIDGQHRLFAYAGLKQAKSAHLNIVAFENLSGDEQLKLFVDINSKQKKVAQSLLTVLYSDFRWNSSDPKDQSSAIISRLVLQLGTTVDSPLFGRISTGEDEKDELRCITIAALAKAFNQREFFVFTAKGRAVVPGAFWMDEPEKTLRRARAVSIAWVKRIAILNEPVWDKGKGPGGALAMNIGLVVMLNVLRAAIQHLSSQGAPLSTVSESDLIAKLDPFSECLARYFKSMDETRLAEFRALYGTAGETTGTRDALLALREMIPGFEPPGLREIAEAREQRTNEKGVAIINLFEIAVRRLIIDDLKSEYGDNEEGWWLQGLPTKILQRIEKERIELGKRGKAPRREEMVRLADFPEIIRDNWDLFGELFTRNKARKRDDRIDWLRRLAEVRSIAEDAKKDPITPEDLEMVVQAKDWFDDRVAHFDDH
jgi:DNA sulfur modification protein DndB